jgi:hypothetical protein
MTRRRSTRNPVRVRAVQFSSRLVGTYGCGQVRQDSGRVRPARFLACGRVTAQIGPENSAGCGSGSMFESECHALVEAHDSTRVSLRSTGTTCKKLRALRQHRTTYFVILGSASSMQSLWVPVPLFDGVRLLHSGFTQNHEYFSLLTTPCPYYQLWYLETTEGSSSSLTFDKCM